MSSKRREFLIATGGAVAAASLSSMAQTGQKQSILGTPVKHELMKLPYPYEALEPVIDARTLELHHTKHHQAYVTGLNKAEEELAKARGSNDYSLIQHWSKQASFHGAGVFLHNLYWNSMGPNAGGKPEGILGEKINKSFGNFDAFKAQFAAAAKAVEASGWAILGYKPDEDRLFVFQVENHQKLTTWNVIPLMTIDVWEHAYYLKYQNKRVDYVDAWWNLVNWKNAEKPLMSHKGEK